MRYTFQEHTDSGCFSSPSGEQVYHAKSKAELRTSLELWRDEVSKYAGEAYLVVWKGRYKDITDIYPEFILKLGRKGGIIKEPC
jgi:hypothetical protein